MHKIRLLLSACLLVSGGSTFGEIIISSHANAAEFSIGILASVWAIGIGLALLLTIPPKGK